MGRRAKIMSKIKDPELRTVNPMCVIRKIAEIYAERGIEPPESWEDVPEDIVTEAARKCVGTIGPGAVFSSPKAFVEAIKRKKGVASTSKSKVKIKVGKGKS